MGQESRKRPPRVPLSQEEVAQLIAYKKLREARRLARFRRSPAYKLFNLFNIACFFAYWEVIFCFLGPCNYQTHYALSVRSHHDDEQNAQGKRITRALDIKGANGRAYEFVINGFIETPERYSEFSVGSDFLLRKELKGMIDDSGQTYYLHAAGSLLFLSVLLIVISITSFLYNLNEQAYSLNAITALNALLLTGMLLI